MRTTAILATATALACAAGLARADGKLNIYNWTDYTAPDLIAKFEAATGIDVTLDTYDTNETLLAKMQAGARGYDIIVPSHNFIPIFIPGGLVQAVDVATMPNFANVDERWRFPAWDPEQKYSAPFHWGTSSVAYRRDLLGHELTSLRDFFEPAEELRGRIMGFETPEEIVNLGHLYLGQAFCNENPEEMQKVQDLLVAQKPYILAYSSEGVNDRLINGDAIIANQWNGNAFRGRITAAEQGKDLAYAYPVEGVIGWADGLLVPTTAENVENARIFMNFVMDPENMALQSDFTGFAGPITGQDAHMSEELRGAPEIEMPADAKMVFSFACNAAAQGLIDRVWTNVLR